MPASVPIPGAHGAIDDRPLHALLDERCEAMPDELAIRHLVDGETSEVLVTWSDLSKRARVIAAWLMERRAAGKTVLLATASGPEFIAGLFGCWHAGAIAVPAYPPKGSRHRQRMQAILADSGASLAIGGEEMAQTPGVETLVSVSLSKSARHYDGEAIVHSGPCLLQYTSGSTAAPKGVMIGHRNFRAHFASLECFGQLGLKSALSWLPPYHDMGLVLKILYACEAGIPLTLFSPDHFIQRPARWLRAISRHRAELSGAPNFAFEACIRSIRDEELEGVDLSCWKAAPCGAERIRRETLERFADRFSRHGFRPEAFLPGYGLAETTLIVTACRADRKPGISNHPTAGTLVSSGAPLAGVSIRITDPESGAILPPGSTGEIRVKAPVVSQGYWQHPEDTRRVFGDDGELRTGDLGYMEDGELFVSGRIKDLIIIDGTNHLPDDIEGAAMAAAPEITAVAAFPTDADSRESASLAIEAAGLAEADRAGLCKAVRGKVADFLEIPIHRIVLVRSGLLPRTTSGKIRRGACGEALQNGSLKILHDDRPCSGTGNASGGIARHLLEMVAAVTGRNDVVPDDDVIRLGMGSLDATRLAAMIRSQLGMETSVAEIFAAGSFAELADRIAAKEKTKSEFPRIGDAGNSAILSHAQERMWFLHQIDPQSASYHVFGALELLGDLSVLNLRAAFREVVSKHGILLSRHITHEGTPRVLVVDETFPEMEVQQTAAGHDAEERLRRFARRPFRLDADPPIRALLLDCGNQRHILAVCAHHIAADGWSLRVLANELADAYACKSVPKERISYQDFAAAHRQWVDGGAVDGQIAYWKSRLAGHSGILQLPTDFPRPHHPSSDGGLVAQSLPAGLCKRIAAVAAARRTTPFAVHLAAFLLLLRQHGAGHDAVVAIPVANRNHAETSGIVGTLVNTLPFRMTLSGGETFGTLLDRVTQASFEMQENQDAPFEKIIEAVKPDRSTDYSPLAQVMFDHQEIPIPESWPGGLTCKPHMAHRGAAQFDLSLLLTVFNDHHQLAFEFRTDLFRPDTITAMMERHLANLERVCSEPDAAASPDLTNADRRWLAGISHGPGRPDFLHRTTPELLAKRVAMHPDREAVSAGGSALTYRNLADRSDRLASALLESGVRPGDRVAVLLERDENLPAALLGVWKAGAAHVPLDRANPAERLRLILSDQAPLHVLVSPRLQDHLPAGIQPIMMDEALMARAGTALLPEIPADGPAYVIYTSGSTGKPKGVVVTHGALANFLLSMAETPGFTEADRLLAVTTVSFDISALELFLPLVSGGSLEIVTTATARDGNLLIEALRVSAATVMQATPATWRLLLDAGWRGAPNLKILCGGEAMDLPLASSLARMGCQLWNLYGPTETTVWSTIWRVPEKPDHIRIGRPIANTGIHVLSDEGIPLPPGVPGDLWISGSGLAEGYWNRPELTASRFLPITAADGKTIRAYQTGDIARWHSDGTLECLGRSDGQVKIRGFRVELGEIEEVLAGHPQVAQAKVALRGSSAATERLVAWIIAAAGTAEPDADALRAYLSERLPVYMLPADYGLIREFPLNANGKVDVSQLPDPESSGRAAGPLSERERQLAAIWSELLHRPSIHPEDNWFHIGGHSLLALRLFARIHQETGRRIPLSAILDHATPRSLAALIDQTAPEP